MVKVVGEGGGVGKREGRKGRGGRGERGEKGGGIRMLDQSTGHSPPGEYAAKKTPYPPGKSI